MAGAAVGDGLPVPAGIAATAGGQVQVGVFVLVVVNLARLFDVQLLFADLAEVVTHDEAHDFPARILAMSPSTISLKASICSVSRVSQSACQADNAALRRDPPLSAARCFRVARGGQWTRSHSRMPAATSPAVGWA